MVCDIVHLRTGGAAIICSSGQRKRCSCGQKAPFLCDWKVPGKKSGTCDTPICAGCASEPAPNKHLCLTHQVAFEKWNRAKEARQ